MNNTTATAIATVLALGGCSNDHHAISDAPTSDDDGPGGDQTVDVSGVGMRGFVTDLGVIVLPRDFSTDPTIASLTPDRDHYVRRSSTVANPGSFTVPIGADAESWLLEVRPPSGSSTFYSSNERAPDLGDVIGGRPDAVAVVQETPITLTASNLAAWQDGDLLEMMVSNLGAMHFDVETELDDTLAPGATTIDGLGFNWAGQAPVLIDATKGDLAELLQLSTKTTGATTYQALSRRGSLPVFTQVAGQAHAATVALDTVTADTALTVSWKRSQYEAFKSLVGPNADDGQRLLAIDALHDANTLGFYAAAPDLVMFSATGNADSSEQFSYGNPFRTDNLTWDEFLISYYAYDVPVLAQGSTTPFPIQAGVFEDRLVAGPTMDVAPIVSPVLDPKLDGADLFTTHANVGLTPVVSWTAPTIGTPTSYVVAVFRVGDNAGTTKLTRTATLVTRDTSIRLPDNTLTAGSSFVMTISAKVVPSATTKAPLRVTLPDATATIATAQFQP